MTRPTKMGAASTFCGFLASLTLLPTTLVTAEDTLEEIVVTGSYIKRDSFDSASPLTIITQDDISNNATPNLGEILVNQTFNYGSDFQTNTYSARAQIGTSTSANLRGLGARSTLPLIDGKRTIQRNFNNALPQIAIKRIDILKDGASALYGTDAVAGVVNIITRKNFSGSKFSFFYTQDDGDDLHEQVYDYIGGSDTDNGHVTFAASFRTRSELQQLERPKFLRQGFERSGTGNPGEWRVPSRDASGAITGFTDTVDPGCGVANGPGGTDVGSRSNFLSGESRLGGTDCAFHFGETWNFMNPNDQLSGWLNFQYEFSDNLSNEIDIIVSRLDAQSRGSPQNPGGRTEEFPIVPGDHPGNPFRAFADANGDGILDDGEQLFALDANGDGIPDRGTIDANGDGLMDVLLANALNPAVSIFDANAIAGGNPVLPFNEDVDVIALRIFGKIGLLDGANQPTALNADGSNNGNATFDVTNYRIADTLRYTFPSSGWDVTATAIFQENHLVVETKNTSQSGLLAGLRGQLVPDPETGATFWNPFSTQALACQDRVCVHNGTPDFANTVGVLDAINLTGTDITDTEFWFVDVIGTGDLFELPAGTVAAAFGAEYRKTSIDVNLTESKNACDWHQGGCEFDYKAEQDVWAAFFEIAVPVVENFDVTLAGRFSDYGGGVGDSFDPKISFLWHPLDILSIRGSFSEAFTAPSLAALFEPEDCGLQTMIDLLTGDTSASFRVRCRTGNSNLTPETADVWNIGASLQLLEGDLTLGVDYAEYDFDNRIAETTGQQVLDQDLQRFNELGFDLNNAADVEAWINTNKGTATGETVNIVRDVSGVVTRIRAGRLNAQSMEHKAYDLYGRYHLSTASAGDFVFRLDATFVDEFSFDLGIGAAGRGDGAGSQNETIVEVPPIPEWRITGSVNWFLGNHSAMLRIRWIDSFDQDIAFFSAFNDPKIDSITYTDVQYAYNFPSLFGDRETRLEIGARNVFDEFPDVLFNLGGIESFVHDIRGRMIYLRINQDL